LSSTYYQPSTVEALIGKYPDNKSASIALQELVDNKEHPLHKQAKEIRQNSKPISFKLAYGGYPDDHKGGFITPEIFDAYHNQLYPGITRFREEYVLPTATSQGQVHLGLGFNLQTDDPDRDIRTLNNACSQFWSILTGLTINKMHQLIDKQGYSKDILITSTIYDSLYFEIREDPTIIKWLNDNLVPVMEQDFVQGQIVHNSADLEIGLNWATTTVVPHNSDLDTITSLIATIKDSHE